jgi:tRNA A-37 threonylcarbamoyl transferase component Bud32
MEGDNVMSEANRCAECGGAMAADSPLGLCPGCLLKRGLETNTFATAGGSPAAADFVPPTPAELAAYFPDLEIIEFIGRGGMGVVYKARQKRLDRLVALKILSPKIGQDPAFAERFQREARAMATLSHPHIVGVHDFDHTCENAQGGGLYYFIMEYVDGVNLRRLLDAQRLSPEQALAIVPQICDALQYAHDHGVVHRDIKPENILMDKNGAVKIADFGLAKLIRSPGSGQHVPRAEAGGTPSVPSAGPAISLTGVGQVMGTPHYMAPEQFEHPKEVDHRADIYSLGVVFYQMLTGELPIGRFAPPSQKVHIDVRLDDVVLKALEKEPQRRYQHASEIKTQVETISHASPAAALAAGAIGGGSTAGPGAVGPVAGLAPTVSKTAVVGAAFAPLSLLFCLFLMAFGTPVTVGPGVTVNPPWWMPALGIALTILGAVAPFLTTILGGVAISQIRHSGGRLYGLPLALADAMLFPLLMLDAMIGYGLDELFHTIGVKNGPVFFLTIVLSLVVDFFIIRWAWQAARQPVGGTAGPQAGGQATAGVPRLAVDAAMIEQAKQQVRGPAIGLLVTGILNWVVLVPLLAIVVPVLMAAKRAASSAGGLSAEVSANLLIVVSIVLIVVVSALLIVAALKMKRLQGYGLAVATSILSMIVSPSNLIGLPIGIWALVVLTQRDVRAAFGQTERPLVSRAELVFGILGLLLCLLCLPIAFLVVRFVPGTDVRIVFPVMVGVGLVLGILGRRSLVGKFAIVIAPILLLLFAAALLHSFDRQVELDFGGTPSVVGVQSAAVQPADVGATQAAIQGVVLSRGQVVVTGYATADSRIVFSIGGAKWGCGFGKNTNFSAILDRPTLLNPHLVCVVIDQEGRRLLTESISGIGAVKFTQGQVVFREGPLKPEKDGPFVVGEYQPPTGQPSPISVQLAQTAEAAGRGESSAKFDAPVAGYPGAYVPSPGQAPNRNGARLPTTAYASGTPVTMPPQAKSSTAPTGPVQTQEATYDIQPGGLVHYTNANTILNDSSKEIRDFTSSMGKVMKVDKITDAAGKRLVYTTEADPNGIHNNCHIFLNAPVPRGKNIEMIVQGTTNALVKPTSEPGLFVYDLADSFGGYGPVRRIEHHRLPAGAKLVTKSTNDLKETTKDGRIELQYDRTLQANEAYRVLYQYREPAAAPSNAGSGSAPSAGPPGSEKTKPTIDAESLRLKLESAERLLKMAEEKHRQGLVTVDEVLKATLARDLAAAEIKGDPLAAAQAKLRCAEGLRKVIEVWVKNGMGHTAEDLEKATLARDLAAEELKRLEGASDVKGRKK